MEKEMEKEKGLGIAVTKSHPSRASMYCRLTVIHQ